MTSPGAEGTLDAFAAALPESTRVPVAPVTGPDGRSVAAAYLRLGDGTAVVQLAAASGQALMARPDPVTANSRGTGEVIAQAIADGAHRLVIDLGGSAAFDGGAGLLRALGLQVTDRDGWAVGPGAAGLLTAVRVNRATLVRPPPGGVIVLADVDHPLLGPHGVAAVSGPQNGATPQEVALIERALAHWARLLGADPDVPRGGAGGGAAAALAAVWGVAPQVSSGTPAARSVLG